MPPARKYPPLNRYLDTLSPDQPSVTLTFRQLEEILGSPLPPSAWLTFYWTGSSVARYNWELSGFRARLDRLTRSVTFTRQERRLAS